MHAQENAETGNRPGVMIYFDMVDPLQQLKDAERGRLLMAIVEYAKHGTQPRFTGRLAMAWGYIQPKLDRDAEAYENTRTQRRYAAYCKKCTARRLPKIPFEQWLEMSEEELQQALQSENEPQRAVAPAASRNRKGKRKGEGDGYGEGNGDGYGDGDGDGDGYGDRKGDGNLNTAVSAAAAADTQSDPAAAAAETALKRMNGELGQGVVNLSQRQMELLLEEMGLEMFDYYVRKLSDFILKNDASVKNHYGTIRRWWQEDHGC